MIQDWRDILEILLLAIGIYQLYRVFRSTRGAQILIGLATIFLVLLIISQLLELQVISWIIRNVAAVLTFGLIVIFQPELRDALARVGSKKIFSFSSKRKEAFTEKFSDCVLSLSKKRIGAIFAIKQSISLTKFYDTGVILDAHFTPELALTIFHPNAPLHDGGMIIADDRVAAAACVFPVTQREVRDRSTGLRHRAAMGLCEETDAIIVVVSEETGGISIGYDSQLERNLNEKLFKERIKELLIPNKLKPSHEDLDSELVGEASLPAHGSDRVVRH